ncbi:MAG: hypothetical protein GPJ54_00985 [Candidatus Heimdallarchaeota archaeon]|nr:hypothetical protein [Candidatus Heimdallarchaeota archaeon]
MSENNESGLSRNIDLFSGLVGLIFIIFVVSTAIISSDNRDEYYSNNPDIVPGTFLFIGLLLLTPLLFYGILLFAKGVWALLIELVDRANENPSQIN